MVLSGLLHFSLFTRTILACSGMNAAAFEKENGVAALLYMGVGVLLLLSLVILYFLRGRKGLTVVILCLMITALHPGWFLSSGGDCGMHRLDAAKIATGIIAMGFLYQVLCWIIPHIRERRA